MATDVVKKKMGRPTLYRPEYCSKVIELGRQGKSKEQIAAQLGLGWNTLGGWAEKHPEFKEALHEAKNLELSFWEDLGLQHIVEVPGSGRLNSAVWNKIMSCRFPHKYSERNKIELTGADGGAIQVQNTHSIAQEILKEIQSDLQITNDQTGSGS
jgi:transposase